MFVVCSFVIVVLLHTSDADSSINNNPETVSIHENYDGTHDMWNVDATCNVRYTYTYTCYTRRYYDCSLLEWGWRACTYYEAKTCYAHAYTDVACNRWSITSDPSGNFQMSGSTVQKKTCTSLYCGPTCNSDGCLNSGESHSVEVTASRDDYETDGAVSGTFTVSVYAANAPTFYYSSGNSISVSHDTAGIGTVLNQMVPSYLDNGNDYDYIRYRQNSGPEASYLNGTTDLFYLDTSNGQVKVGKDLSYEFSYFFTLNLCVYDRREREACLDLSITLWACFQTPNCTNQQNYNLHDVYGTYTGHGGSSNTLFNMIYPQPSEHFTAFSTVWHDLTWTFDTNEFPEAAINADTGEIYITRNISIWPAWPTQDYNIVARVANSESCHSTTCAFKIRVHYTNWPIDICSLPNSYSLSEDYDTEIMIHQLYTCDYNYYWEDNSTCEITDWSPKENDMFELRPIDGNFAYNSYQLYKLRCQEPGCGYKYQSPRAYYCDTDIGCLTHNRTQQYTVTIQCSDGYNSSDTDVFTFNVIKNQAPTYRNVPNINCGECEGISFVGTGYNHKTEPPGVAQCSNVNTKFARYVQGYGILDDIYEHVYKSDKGGLAGCRLIVVVQNEQGNNHIDLNSQTVTYLDNIFQIMYSDNENENLIYEYDIIEVGTTFNPGYFNATAWGNYYDNLGNITMTTYLWDKEVNKTYSIYICGHERRNEICDYLTIDVEEYCSTAPQCSDDSFSTDTEFAIGGELFNIKDLVYGGTFTDNLLSFSITALQGHLFAVDSTTGQVTTAGAFDEIFDSATYSITAFVYHTGSCSYGQCQLTVTVAAINYAVAITNLPATVVISEDTTASGTLLTVTTSDANAGDTYTCEIVNTNSVEPFYLERIPPESGDYIIKNRENGALSSATTTYSVSIECTDSHQGSDTEVLTIEVTLNQAPAYTNFAAGATTSVTADPMNFNQGDTLYTVTATDNENDALTFTCTIPTSIVPFQCVAGTTSVDIKVSRDLRIDDDNGATYTVEICLRDAKHTDQCGTLEVTFTRVKTRPEITNLPDSKSFPETAGLGTTIYEATISDPDVGESHYFSVSVDPPTETSAFTLDTSNGILTLTQSLDYEHINSYTFTFSVRDDYLDGLTEKALKMAVTNVNEGNSIIAATTTITFAEDTAASTELTDPVFTCTDIDGDATTYAIHSGLHNDYFSINSNTGRISLAKVWDLEDSGTTLPSSTSLAISCTDPGGLSSTTFITVDIEDVNDIAPNLILTAGSSPISISPSTCLCTDLMSFSASDSDFSDDDDFEFGIMGDGVGSEYFRMVKIGTSAAKLRLKKVPDFTNDKTFSITIKASDGEPSPLYDGETVVVNYTAGDPDESKSKPPTKCLTCTSNGKALIAVLAVEGAICIGFIAHVVYNCFCFRDGIRRLPRTGDQSLNQRFRQRLSKLTKGGKPGLGGLAVTKTSVIEMNQMRKNDDKKRQESSGSSSSASSSSSDSDDDRIRPFPHRPDVGNSRFRPAYSKSAVRTPPSTGLPSPIYTSGSTASGQPCSPGGIAPGFIV